MVKIFMDNRVGFLKEVFGNTKTWLCYPYDYIYSFHTDNHPIGPSRHVTREFVLEQLPELKYYNGEEFTLEIPYYMFDEHNNYRVYAQLSLLTMLSTYSVFNPDIVVAFWHKDSHNLIKTREDQIFIEVRHDDSKNTFICNNEGEITNYSTSDHKHYTDEEVRALKIELAKALDKYFARKACNVKSANNSSSNF